MNQKVIKSLLLGPIFHHHGENTFCLMIFSRPVESIAVDLKTSTEDAKTLSKAKSAGKIRIFGKGSTSRELKISNSCIAYVSQLVFTKKQQAQLRKSRFHFYRLLVNNEEPLDFKSKLTDGSNSKLDKEMSARFFTNGWIGNADVFRTPYEIDSKVHVSCFDAAKDMPKGGLQSVYKALLTNRKGTGHEANSQSIYLLGDQIYADVQPLEWKDICKEAGAKLSGRRPTPSSRSTIKKIFNEVIGVDTHLNTQWEYLSAYLIIYGWGTVTVAKDALNKMSKKRGKSKEMARRIEAESNKYSALMLLFPTVWMWDDHDITDDWNLQRKPEPKEKRRQDKLILQGLPPLALIQRPMMFIKQKALNYPDKSSKTITKLNESLMKDSKTTRIGNDTLVLENRVNRKFGVSRVTNMMLFDIASDKSVKDLKVYNYKIAAGLATPPTIDKRVLNQLKAGGSVVIQTHPLTPLNYVRGINFLNRNSLVNSLMSKKATQLVADMEMMDYYPDRLGHFMSEVSKASKILSGDIHAGYVRDLLFLTTRKNQNKASKFTIGSAGALKNKNKFYVRKALKWSRDMQDDQTTIRIFLKTQDCDHTIWLLIPSNSILKYNELNSIGNAEIQIRNFLGSVYRDTRRKLRKVNYQIHKMHNPSSVLKIRSAVLSKHIAEFKKLRELTADSSTISETDVYILKPLTSELVQNIPNYIRSTSKKVELYTTKGVSVKKR